MKKHPRYANWISFRPIVKGAALTLFFILAALLCYALWGRPTFLFYLCLVPAALFLAVTLLLAATKMALSYRLGKAQSKVLDYVASHLDLLPWDHQGTLLDIGCGSGAMSIKVARKFPRLHVQGMDAWGADWYYSQAQCQQNARLEGVEEQIAFVQGDAARLDFPDGTFDAAISNLVFHEVRSQPDKLALVREALRVVKPGGVFVFQDIFYSQKVYGDLEQFLSQLKGDVAELRFVDSRRVKGIPRIVGTRFVLGNAGLIYGKK